MGFFGFGKKKKKSKSKPKWRCGNCGKPTRYPRVFCAKCDKIHQRVGIKKLRY